jgi:hypothetical protein
MKETELLLGFLLSEIRFSVYMSTNPVHCHYSSYFFQTRINCNRPNCTARMFVCFSLTSQDVSFSSRISPALAATHGRRRTFACFSLMRWTSAFPQAATHGRRHTSVAPHGRHRTLAAPHGRHRTLAAPHGHRRMPPAAPHGRCLAGCHLLLIDVT